MQHWENGKNLNFWPNLGSLKIFSWVLPLLVVGLCSKSSSYSISKKTKEQNLKKWLKKKLIWATWPKFGPQVFLRILPLLVIRNCSMLSSYAILKKNKVPNLRKWQKKTNFGPDFGLFDPNLGPPEFLWHVLSLLVVRHCYKRSYYAI